KRLMKENVAMAQAVGGVSARLPEVWINYAVQGVKSAYFDPQGCSTPVSVNLIAEEAQAQTGMKPVNCRPSRHGATGPDGETTWIISYLEPVRAFRLLGASDHTWVK